MGMIPVTIFTSLNQHPLLILTRNKFEWKSYADPKIQECIPDEFFANCNIWHVKVSLIVFVTMEMHESN
ncbi:hypothetical protein J1N35_038358 [Gossypium stocksii]|uniref:Uncharacterized protein n=1 Tax=Gossypium stocksii TaxID=47602 RepID=A0A9D3UML2_9ROSI|nr:hypothetical protein J1N35_038358 [Gossypium stocksii]